MKAERDLVRRFGIMHAPAYTLNGRLYQGWGSWELFRGGVDEERRQMDALLKSGNKLPEALRLRTAQNLPKSPDATAVYAALVQNSQASPPPKLGWVAAGASRLRTVSPCSNSVTQARSASRCRAALGARTGKGQNSWSQVGIAVVVGSIQRGRSHAGDTGRPLGHPQRCAPIRGSSRSHRDASWPRSSRTAERLATSPVTGSADRATTHPSVDGGSRRARGPRGDPGRRGTSAPLSSGIAQRPV
jgi:hypothetical protein